MDKLAIAHEIEKTEILIEVFSTLVPPDSPELTAKQEKLKELNERYLELMVSENGTNR